MGPRRSVPPNLVRKEKSLAHQAVLKLSALVFILRVFVPSPKRGYVDPVQQWRDADFLRFCSTALVVFVRE